MNELKDRFTAHELCDYLMTKLIITENDWGDMESLGFQKRAVIRDSILAFYGDPDERKG